MSIKIYGCLRCREKAIDEGLIINKLFVLSFLWKEEYYRSGNREIIKYRG